MTELKIGGNSVGKIMYNGQEFGGTTKLEPGTILYISGQNVGGYNSELNQPYSTAEITFPNAGKHWEGLKKIRIYYKESSLSYNQVFDVNSIDEPTPIKRYANLTIKRKRSLNDEADKLIATTGKEYSDLVIITVEEWN